MSKNKAFLFVLFCITSIGLLGYVFFEGRVEDGSQGTDANSQGAKSEGEKEIHDDKEQAKKKE